MLKKQRDFLQKFLMKLTVKQKVLNGIFDTPVNLYIRPIGILEDILHNEDMNSDAVVINLIRVTIHIDQIQQACLQIFAQDIPELDLTMEKLSNLAEEIGGIHKGMIFQHFPSDRLVDYKQKQDILKLTPEVILSNARQKVICNPSRFMDDEEIVEKMKRDYYAQNPK